MTFPAILATTILAQVIFWTAVIAYILASSKAAHRRREAAARKASLPHVQGLSGVEELPVTKGDTKEKEPPKKRFYR